MSQLSRIIAGLALVGVFAMAASLCLLSRGGGHIEHPAGPGDLVLRVGHGAIFGPLADSFEAVPSFSLYGYGRVIASASGAATAPRPPLPSLATRRVSEEGIQTILNAARLAGLHGADRRLDTVGVDDAGATIVTVVADGRRHETVAPALGALGVPVEDRENVPLRHRGARRLLLAFISGLSRLDEWLPSGSIGREEPFIPDRFGVFTHPPDPEGLFSEGVVGGGEIDWPLGEPIASFGGPLEGYYEPPFLLVRCGIVEGDDLEAILAAARGASEGTAWLSEGERYTLVLRPLLPDERRPRLGDTPLDCPGP